MRVPEEKISLDTRNGIDNDIVDMKIGGQAVIEGVMMRSPEAIATAVRLPDGTIELKKREYISFVKRYRLFDIPVIRGAVSFFEMLVIGLDTLNWSADIQMQYEDSKKKGKVAERRSLWNTILLGGTLVFAFLVALGIFFRSAYLHGNAAQIV